MQRAQVWTAFAVVVLAGSSSPNSALRLFVPLLESSSEEYVSRTFSRRVLSGLVSRAWMSPRSWGSGVLRTVLMRLVDMFVGFSTGVDQCVGWFC